MANKKIKFPLWLMPDTKATVECLYRQDGCNSQSEFIEKAIQFYCGYLQSEYAGDFLPKILGETLEAILSMFGDRIGKLLLKQAVEQNVCNHILASDTDIDAQTYQQMRGKSYQEVLREKMDAYCMQREHKPLEQLCQELLQEQDVPIQEMQM